MYYKQRMLVIVSGLIIVGFTITAAVSFYLSRQSALTAMVEQQLPLTSDNIYAEVQRDLIKPRTVSSFMGSDTFLQDWILSGEQDINAISRYLKEIREKYGAFTAFMVSDLTRNYYYADGVLKQVSESDERDAWYFRVRQMPVNSELNLDPDMANQDQLTIFINFKIRSVDGTFLGATGLGLNLASIHKILTDYRHRYGNDVYFVTPNGQILLSEKTSGLPKNLHQIDGMQALAKQVLSEQEGHFTYVRDGREKLLNTRRIDELNLILCVEADVAEIARPLMTPLLITLLVSVLVTAVVLYLLLLVIRHYQSGLEDVAWQDPLTGLLNRRAFIDHYERAKSSHDRKGLPLSLLMMDIDHFKQVNDRFGHARGDQILQQVASTLSCMLRPSDVLGRWGGEEFILLLPDTGLEQAQRIAERIRQQVAESGLVDESAEVRVTLSLGVAEQQGLLDLDQHVHAADTALYAAKQAGRNCVIPAA